MSLINQMLKDLARRNKPLSDPDVLLAGLLPSQSTSKKNKFRYLFFIINGFFIILLAIFLFQKLLMNREVKTNTANTIAPFEPVTKAAPPPDKSRETNLTANAVTLSGMILQINNNISNLRLLLNQNVLYRIIEKDKEKLVIILENTKLLTSLPQIDTANSAINVIQTMAIDNDLKIVIHLNKGAELKQLNLVGTPQSSELNIDLGYNPLQVGTEEGRFAEVLEEAQPVKTPNRAYQIEVEYQQAEKLIDEGETLEAIIALAKILEKDAKFAPARKTYVKLLLSEGKVAEAESILDVGLKQHPFFPDFVQLKAQILVDKGKTKQALTLLLKAPPALRENPDYHAFMAALYQRQNNFLVAEKIYEQLLATNPNNAIWWIGLGVAREGLKKQQEALFAYSKVNSVDDLNPELKVYVENRIRVLS